MVPRTWNHAPTRWILYWRGWYLNSWIFKHQPGKIAYPYLWGPLLQHDGVVLGFGLHGCAKLWWSMLRRHFRSPTTFSLRFEYEGSVTVRCLIFRPLFILTYSYSVMFIYSHIYSQSYSYIHLFIYILLSLSPIHGFTVSRIHSQSYSYWDMSCRRHFPTSWNCVAPWLVSSPSRVVRRRWMLPRVWFSSQRWLPVHLDSGVLIQVPDVTLSADRR